MKKFKAGFLIVALVAAALVVYAYLSKDDGTDTDVVKEASEITKLLAKDIEKEYPLTPREVVKLYTRITINFYAEDHTDEEIEKLVDMSFALFDDELLKENPKSEYLGNLKNEIEEYKMFERVINDYTIQGSNMIEKYMLDGVEYAKVRVLYRMRDIEKVSEKTKGFLNGCGKGDKVYRYYWIYEDFLLRKDGNGRWKILVWNSPDIEDMDDEDK